MKAVDQVIFEWMEQRIVVHTSTWHDIFKIPRQDLHKSADKLQGSFRINHGLHSSAYLPAHCVWEALNLVPNGAYAPSEPYGKCII